MILFFFSAYFNLSRFSLAGLFFLLTGGLLLICCGIFVTVFQPYEFIFKWVSTSFVFMLLMCKDYSK